METLFSPIGDIEFMAVGKPVPNFAGDKLQYKIKLRLDPTSKDAQEFAAKLRSVDPRKVDTENNLKNGTLVLSFQSQFPVKVFDVKGDKLITVEKNEAGESVAVPTDHELAPAVLKFFAGSDTGKASVRVALAKLAKPMGKITHSVYLQEIGISEITTGIREEQESEMQKHLRASQEKLAAKA